MPNSLTPEKLPVPVKPESNIDLNLIGTVCPMGFVKARIFLDKQNSGDTVALLYEDTPANEPLIRSIGALGHKIIEQIPVTIPLLNTEVEKPKTPSASKEIQAFKLSIQVKM